jgi:hypothetical protein
VRCDLIGRQVMAGSEIIDVVIEKGMDDNEEIVLPRKGMSLSINQPINEHITHSIIHSIND